jgi:hypothetical protein
MTDEPRPDAAKARVIRLTTAPPVRIREQDWPVIASGRWYTGPIEFPRATKGWIFVRRRSDGCVIVYGGLGNKRAGEIVSPRSGVTIAVIDDIVDAIVRVARELDAPNHVPREIVTKLPPVDM